MMRLEVKDIHKNFQDNYVLKGVNFAATGGKALGLLGRNGAGKTTTIRIIMDVFPADSGAVLVDGNPIDYNQTKFGYLPEERGLYPKKKVAEQLIYIGRLRGLSKREADASIKNWLSKFDIDDYYNRRLDTLSKGNQQKIQLIATLLNNPDILILDEPFAGLDPVNSEILQQVVREQIAAGKIVLFSSHQMNYVEEFCDSIAILHGGEIVVSGNIEALKSSYERDTLTVSTPDPLLLKDYCVKNLSALIKEVSTGHHTVTVQLNTPRDKAVVMQHLTASGVDINALQVKEPTLNEIFVQYASDEAENENEKDKGGKQ